MASNAILQTPCVRVVRAQNVKAMRSGSSRTGSFTDGSQFCGVIVLALNRQGNPPTSSVFVSVPVVPTTCASTIGSPCSSRRGGPNTNHCALRAETLPSSGSARRDGAYAPISGAKRHEGKRSAAPFGRAARGRCGDAAFANCGRYQPDKLQGRR